MERLNVKGKEVQRRLRAKDPRFGHENSLKETKPIFNRAAKTLKKRVQSDGLQSDLVALIFVNG